MEDPLNFYDPKLCFLLDGFLGLYGLFITAMFVREKFFRPKVKIDNESVRAQGSGFDAERGRGNRGQSDSDYMPLRPRGEDSEYRELPRRQQRQKNEQLYQGLSAATRDTYDTLQQR